MSFKIGILVSRLKFTMGAFQKRFNLSHLLLDALNRIFETIIMPILSYNAEVWEVYNKHDFEHWDKTTTEKAHIRFCKVT